MPAVPSSLPRSLGTADAVVIGLGAMLGAGVFVAVGPAAAAAGPALLAGLLVAAAVAWCNATSTAALAAVHPVAGGAYAYARARLSEGWGATAGWAFLLGKTASCAALAQTFAAYAVPKAQNIAALLAIVVLWGVDVRGVRRTVRVTAVLVLSTVVALAVAVVGMLTAADLDADRLVTGADWSGVPQAAAVLFFAFAGYARIATLGEEVREPERVIPRAIPLALGGAVAIYALVAVVALVAVGAPALAESSAPLADGAGDVAPVVRAGAVVATLGVLLSVLGGIGRTAFAMARDGELPRALAAVSERHSAPYRASTGAAAAAGALVLVTDAVSAIGVSACTVLVYYAIANACALRLRPEERRWPRVYAAAGLAGCLGLALSLPVDQVALALGLLAAALAARWVASRT